MINYKGANNARGTLLNGVSAVGVTITLNSGEGDRFPSVYPYFLTLEKGTVGAITQRELVKVTNKSGDVFTIVRSAGTCLPDDTSTTQGTTAFLFDPSDSVSLYIPYEIIEDIYNGIVDRLIKSGDYMTGLFGLAESSNIASAATTNLSTATGNTVHITGTTTITSFGTVTAGVVMNVIFDGVLTLTYNATSLILPKSENLVTQAGDVGIFESMGSGNWKCLSFQRANGQAIDTSTDIASLTEDTVGDMTADYLVKEAAGVNKKILVNKYMASDAEALAGTVTNKFLNPEQGKNNYGLVAAAGTAITLTSGGVHTSSSTSYLKKAEHEITGQDGTFTVTFAMYSQNNDGTTVSGRIYKNGVAIGTERTTASGTAQVYAESFSFVQGDLVQLYLKGSASSAAYSDYFKIQYEPAFNKFTGNIIS